MPKQQRSQDELTPDTNLGELIPQPLIVPLTVAENNRRRTLLERLGDAVQRWRRTSEFKL